MRFLSSNLVWRKEDRNLVCMWSFLVARYRWGVSSVFTPPPLRYKDQHLHMLYAPIKQGK